MDGIILGIEASAKVAGAAVWKNDMIAACAMVNGTLTHSETLMPIIERCMQMAGIEPEALSAIALSAGPGSFTGLRIGAATAKGLAAGLGIRLVPVNTLEAIAWNIAPTDALIVPMMDARRSQVYAAVYAFDAEGNMQTVVPAGALSPRELAEKIVPYGKRAILLGDAAKLYPQILTENGIAVTIAPAHLRYASPAAVASLGAAKFARGLCVSGSELVIDYLRKPQAEREREEREQKHAD